MNTPFVEVDLSKVRDNTRTIVARLKRRGVSVSAVTKAVCGHPAIAQAMLDAGASGLAESRINNVKTLRDAGMACPITLIRTPMLSQIDQVVKICDASYNTEIVVINALATAAIQQGRVHGIILMIELGDLREGILPKDLIAVADQVVNMPGVALIGLGANFACLSGLAPTVAQMAVLSDLADETESQCGLLLKLVSGGNSANLPWALGCHAVGRVNDLRIGEAILLGVDPVTGKPIMGMYNDAFTLVAEVIETDSKSTPRADNSADPALIKLHLVPDSEDTTRLILAIGHQDIDVAGLTLPAGCRLAGASSDHLVMATSHPPPNVGTQMRFQMNYSALMHAFAAPDIITKLLNDQTPQNTRPNGGHTDYLALV